MDQVTGDTMEQQPAVSGRERRVAQRGPVIKSAKIVIGGGSSVFDCLVLDESAGGVMVDFGTLVDLPEEAVVHLSGGAFPVRRAWTAGTKAGLTYTGVQIVAQDTAKRMRLAAELMDTQGLGSAIRLMRLERFYDNPDLRRAAEEAEAAQARLHAQLVGRPVIQVT